MNQFQRERADLEIIQARSKEIRDNRGLIADIRALQEEWSLLVQQLDMVTNSYRHHFCERMRHRHLREIPDEEIREVRETGHLLAAVARELQTTKDICHV